MAEKMNPESKTEHIEGEREAARLEGAQRRSSIGDDIPVQEVLDNHLDEDPKRIARIRRRVDLRLTLMLAVLYLFAFLDRANLGNVRIAGLLLVYRI